MAGSDVAGAVENAIGVLADGITLAGCFGLIRPPGLALPDAVN
jgi:hypothetical protein